MVSNVLGTRHQFHGRQSFHGPGSVDGLGVIQAYYIYQSLGHEDPLEEEMATHASILARKIPWTEEPGVLQSMGSQRVRHD